MKRIVSTIVLLTVCGIACPAFGNKVVVVPLFGGEKATGNAVAGNVLKGTTFSNSNGVNILGTMADREGDNVSSSQTAYSAVNFFAVPSGYYDGNDRVSATDAEIASLDSDISSGNIRSGVTIFGVTGNSHVVNTGSGDAGVGDILAGKKAWVDGLELSGNISTQSLSPDSATLSAGYYNATTLSTVDSDLAAGKIKSGTTIFGVSGTYQGESAPVARTGQTTQYMAGDDRAIQAGVVWPTPRFTDNGDETVTDNLTGLMWQTSLNIYGTKTWADAINQCDSAGTGSYTDWHLPNVHELYSVMSKGHSNPALLTGHPFTDVVHGNYWTSTTLAGISAQAWFVNLGSSHILGADKTPITLSVWCVRD